MKISKHIYMTLILLLVVSFTGFCQDALIRYNQYYSIDEAKKGCMLQFKVMRVPKLRGTLTINRHSYSGYMEMNKNNKEIIYNFYYNMNGKKKLILLQFNHDKDCYNVTIINPEYLQLFKPCFDEKYILLISCE